MAALDRAPEGDGCAGRFIRTFEENLLRARHVDAVEGRRQVSLDRQALLSFRDTT